MFIREIGEIYRLKIPFDGEVYTSVFLIKNEQGHILIDCATTDFDVENYILPALKGLGISAMDIKYLALTHVHCDHAGGKERLLQLNPMIEIVTDSERNFQNGYTMYALKGHTMDSVGVFDEKTNTLIAGDGLQGWGIGKYGCTFESQEEYIKTIEQLKTNKSVENVLFSHNFAPWKTYGVFGRGCVEKCLQDCIEYLIKE